jgi:hypothetical protein
LQCLPHDFSRTLREVPKVLVRLFLEVLSFLFSLFLLGSTFVASWTGNGQHWQHVCFHPRHWSWDSSIGSINFEVGSKLRTYLLPTGRPGKCTRVRSWKDGR